MLKQTAILAVAGLASAATVPTRWASVYNNCNWDVFVTDGETVNSYLPKGQIYTNGYPKDGEKKTFKIARATDGVKVPTLLLSFGTKNGKVNYELTTGENGSPFSGSKIEVSSSNDKCPKIEWSQGVPAGSNHGSCSADNSIAVGLCL
ncbi:hypothetical protein NLG97_g5858 [Lecanicillium saksenae]|uniref:Uncharacterized protein n=1 Tax=Lecanicillium saksenae TaxID=468837 RepID=A0ACC1QTN6_9HYPO|nr:hypothetical protein NLG97_g5858 [Lecanicillium saksenae]